MKHFYSHLIKIDTLIIELDSLNFSPTQKLHLASLIDGSLHNAILDAILSQLSEEDKKLFIHHLTYNDHDKIWQLLNTKIDRVEEKIKKAVEQLKEELHKDIKDSSKLKMSKLLLRNQKL